MNTRQIGLLYEQKVSQYLEERGFTVLERNYSCLGGEIDIISSKENELHITEVKKVPSTWEINDIDYKITKAKMFRIKRTCSYYLAHSAKYKYDIIKFDVACISGETIIYWEGAF